MKKGFAYYSLRTDRYQDAAIKRLKRALGCVGVCVYDYIVCEIYRIGGGVIVWDESSSLDVAEYFGLTESQVGEVVSYCLAMGLFDKELFLRGSVLSSLAIQQKYSEMCNRSHRRVDIPEEFILHASCACRDKSAKSTDKNAICTDNFANGDVTSSQDKTAKCIDILAKNLDKSVEYTDKSVESFDFLIQKKRKEKEREKEKEKAPSPSPCYHSINDLVDVDTLADEALQNRSFVEYCLMHCQIEEDMLKRYLYEFCLFLKSQNETRKRERDFRTHFYNWIGRNLERLRKTASDEKKKPNPSREVIPDELKDEELKVYKLYPKNRGYLVKVFRQYMEDHDLTPQEALSHFEYAYKKGLNYFQVLYRAQTAKQLLTQPDSHGN